MPPKALAIIAGAGPGIGLSLALRFSTLYTIILLSRRPSTLAPLVARILSSSGDAHGIPVDVGSAEGVRAAFGEVGERFPGREVRVGVFNVAGGRPVRRGFLECTGEEWLGGVEVPCRGAFNFSQAILPHLLSSASASPPSPFPTPSPTPTPSPIYPPTLIFTGATASLKSSAHYSTFSPGKFALRALSQSLAREFGPRGVHVGHAVVDGVVDTELARGGGAGEGVKINPHAIAEEYWHLHTQPRSAWSWEIEIRPYLERW